MKDIIEKISEYALEEIMGERFGRYSKYIIQDRAIPDVRDGLKPVQRRILYAMYKDKNTFDKPHRKSVKTVGNVIGNYHPHGDSSVYEAMVRLSQSWKVKNPLIDMHGNNGSIDGDGPAAMRYTEARLSKISNELLRDIDKETVNFSWNFDDTTKEPTVLPAKFPNLLVNGSSGISAGYATNIPPHNLGEVIDATIKRIDNPNCHLETILDIIKGPDFPTGGIVEGIDGIKEAYKAGRGKIVLKSKTMLEESKNKNQIIITEIPYEINKSSIVKKIDEIKIDKKIDGIIDVRDESDRDNLVRIVIDIKKESDSNLILNYLLKNTDLQVTYSFNMIAIVNRRPKLLGVLEILDAYIKHQEEVITKRSVFDLEHARMKLHIVEGLIRALSILDDIIKTIRASKNKQDAENNLVNIYNFTPVQAEEIVKLQLYKLTNTDVTSLEEESKNLNIIIKGLEAILNDENLLKNVIKDELRKIKKEYNIDRLTEIKAEITEIKIDTTDLIAKEDVIVVVTKDGYVKRVSSRSYGAVGEEPTTLKDLDYVIGLYEMSTLDTLLLFTNLGNYLYVPVHELPDAKWKELGKHISNIISIKAEESIIGSVPVYDFDEDKYITAFTKLGMIKRTKLIDYKIQRYSKPITAIKLKSEDEVVNISNNQGNEVLISTHNGYGLWYDISEVPIIGLKASGVKAINLKDDYVVSGSIFNKEADYITIITDKGTGKRIKLSDIEKTSRPRKGLLLIREVKTNPHYLYNVLVADTKDMIGIKIEDEIKSFKVSELPIMDRHSTGTNLIKGNIKNVFEVVKLTSKEHSDIIKVEPKKDVSLNEIDNQILRIDDFLDDIDFSKEKIF
jgi:topoisomerase-4 subunit A